MATRKNNTTTDAFQPKPKGKRGRKAIALNIEAFDKLKSQKIIDVKCKAPKGQANYTGKVHVDLSEMAMSTAVGKLKAWAKANGYTITEDARGIALRLQK